MRISGVSIPSSASMPACESCQRAGGKSSEGKVHCLKYGWVAMRMSCGAYADPKKAYRPTVQRRSTSPQEAPKPRKTRPVRG